jgi:hypothetical protein
MQVENHMRVACAKALDKSFPPMKQAERDEAIEDAVSLVNVMWSIDQNIDVSTQVREVLNGNSVERSEILRRVASNPAYVVAALGWQYLRKLPVDSDDSADLK